jgi:hypothetical protein
MDEAMYNVHNFYIVNIKKAILSSWMLLMLSIETRLKFQKLTMVLFT